MPYCDIHNPFYDFDDLAKAALKAPSPYDLITGWRGERRQKRTSSFAPSGAMLKITLSKR